MNFPPLQVAHWRLIYKGIDVDAELLKMEAWLDANPKRRKKNEKRFVVNWLNRTAMQFAWKQLEAHRYAQVGKNLSTGQSDEPFIDLVNFAIEESHRTGRDVDEIMAERKSLQQSKHERK
jgi:hypothetical protein